jgi:hypothetical protein
MTRVPAEAVKNIKNAVVSSSGSCKNSEVRSQKSVIYYLFTPIFRFSLNGGIIYD